MADNVDITAGSGTTVGTDDVSGVHFQKIKIVDGTADSSTAIPGDATNGLDVDVTRVGGDVTTIGKAASGSAVSGNPVLVAGQDGTNARTLKTDTSGELQVDVLTLPALPTGTNEIGKVAGTVAHDASTANNPVTTGGRAVAHGSNPTAVAAGDVTDAYYNRAGVPFVMGGHPNVITSSIRLTGSSTDAAVIAGTINSGTKVVVTRVTVNISNETTINVGVKLGFGATTLPGDSTTGATGVLVDSDGFPPGGGVNIGDGSGIIGVGGDGEEIRITNDAPTTGSLHVTVSYFTIES